MEGKGKLIMIKMNSVPQGIEKISDKDRTTCVGQMHPIVKETVTVPFDLGDVVLTSGNANYTTM